MAGSSGLLPGLDSPRARAQAPDPVPAQRNPPGRALEPRDQATSRHGELWDPSGVCVGLCFTEHLISYQKLRRDCCPPSKDTTSKATGQHILLLPCPTGRLRSSVAMEREKNETDKQKEASWGTTVLLRPPQPPNPGLCCNHPPPLTALQ